MKTVLTIAGSDPTGGAGIQADLKTMTSLGVFGMSAVTALTAQNTTGVSGVLETPVQFVEQQLDCIFTDIFPDAVKIGMVSSAPIIRSIGDKLRQYGAKNIVVDPVMVATSGGSLMQESAVEALTQHLFPLAVAITPNLPEGERLWGGPIRTKEDMLQAAASIGGDLPGAVILKGGHRFDDADDLLWQRGEARWYPAARVDNPNTHGTGCTLSSALASFLAIGLDLPEAFRKAKVYITMALEAQLDLGKGKGPLKHCYSIPQGGNIQ